MTALRNPVYAPMRGQVAELMCAALVLERGWGWAWTPDGCAYDGLVCFDADDPNTWWRVQVKRIYMRNDTHRPTVDIRHRRGLKYSKGDADYLAAIDVLAGRVYLFPWDMVYRKTRLAIRSEHDRYLIQGSMW